MATLEFDLNPAVDCPAAGLINGDVVSSLPGPSWSWENWAPNEKLIYLNAPSRLSFDYARSFASTGSLAPNEAGFLYLPGGPRVIHLVMAVLEAPEPLVLMGSDEISVLAVADGARLRFQAGWWLSGAVQGTASARPAPLGSVQVVTIIAEEEWLRILVNGVEHEALPWTMSHNAGYVTLNVPEGAWDLHRAQWWSGIPETLEDDVAALVAEYVIRRPLGGVAALVVDGAAHFSEGDPWADIDIPDPEEPGGAVEPPELPEPVDPPDPDW